MRILHTMLRVGNLERSIDFYTRVLGMQLLRTTDRPEQQYTLAFVGYPIFNSHIKMLLHNSTLQTSFGASVTTSRV